MSPHLSALRKEYTKSGLHRSELLQDPIAQFRSWLDIAIREQLPEPNAMTVATVDASGQPNARIVLLKGIDDRGFHFYTNQESAKGQELAARPIAALVFLWMDLERQVRIRGPVAKLTRADTDLYFGSRPRGSQLSAWISQQSAVISSREELEHKLADLDRKYPEAVPAPPHWGGYAVQPTEIEFWQGRANRLHDRFRYSRNADGIWSIARLSP